MTPDVAVDPIEQNVNQPPSTAGMTTKIVKGSLWTLGGSVLPLAVSFIATPIVIRLLGSESYGVLLLVGLVPTYLSFADFGMALASTTFASEAFGEGDREKERRVLWTAGTIAGLSSLSVALPIFVFSGSILAALNVPENLHGEATIALKMGSIAFVIGILATVLNSPMTARLRMDLNTLSGAVPRILLAGLTPVILYLGGGIVGAVAWSLAMAILSLMSVVYFSSRMLEHFGRFQFDRSLVRPLVKFGGGILFAMMAAMLLINLEKLLLTKMVSVKALAYYSVAFTFANMATLFSSAMAQSLLPAFVRLQAPERQSEFRTLFGRAIRMNLLWLVPAILIMLTAAKPFFTLWAGEEFGRESTLPFCILLVGLFFNVIAFAPHSTILAAGHTHLFAKLYWVELAFYGVLAYLLIASFGIIGAAAAWTTRCVLDGFLIIAIAKRKARVSFSMTQSAGYIGLVAVVIVPIVFAATLYSDFSLIMIPIVGIIVLLYALTVWKIGLDESEREWLKGTIRSVVK